jgi:CPA2 family monovalent cation:H+ antiporter-2
MVSIGLNPLLYRLVDLLEARARRSDTFLARWGRKPPAVASAGPDAAGSPDATPTQAIVVGYGPIGRTLVRLLLDNEIQPAIVELNMDTVRRLRAEGLRAVYGDATHKATMIEAGADRAVAVVFSSAGMRAAEEAIRVVRECNPSIRVLARANYLREVPALRRAGADAGFSGEGEVALTMTEFMMRQLGATVEQIDRTGDRVREELFGTPQTVELLLPLPQNAPEPSPQADSKPAVE